MLRPRVALLLVLAAVAACRTRPEAPALTPTPATLDEFRAAAERIVRETGVPGAAVALVRPHGI